MAQLASSNKAVTTAGTALRLQPTSAKAQWIRLTANSGNTGDLVIGGTNVAAAEATRKGVVLAKTKTEGVLIQGPVDLINIWVDSLNNGDAVHYTTLLP